MYYSLTVFARTTTIFGLVARRWEFLFFIIVHIVFVALFASDTLPVVELDDMWQSVSAAQFFLTFFLTFYNAQCYARYMRLYDCSMDVLDGVLLFVQELVVSIPHQELENSRLTAAKYFVAIPHIFFMSVVGGRLWTQDWKELVKKGLLTRDEAYKLEVYPARSQETIYVLASWAMQALDTALMHPKMWEPRSMRIAHCHDRAYKHCSSVLEACNEIHTTLSLPVPFAYFNLMNMLLVCNATLLAVVGAFFKTYMTVPPFAAMLCFYIGLREISATLADPFGPDDVDFPVNSFTDYCFDNSICLVEAFRDPISWNAQNMLDRCHEFTDNQLRRQTKASVLYQKGYDPVTSNPFAWSREMPMQTLAGTPEGPSQILSKSLISSASPETSTIGVGRSGGVAEIVIDSDSDDDDDLMNQDEQEQGGSAIKAYAKVAINFISKRLKYRQAKDAKAHKDRDNSKVGKMNRERTLYERELAKVTEDNMKLEHELQDLRDRVWVHRQKVDKLGITLPPHLMEHEDRLVRDSIDFGKTGRVGGRPELASVVVAAADPTAEYTFANFSEARILIRKALNVEAAGTQPQPAVVGPRGR